MTGRLLAFAVIVGLSLSLDSLVLGGRLHRITDRDVSPEAAAVNLTPETIGHYTLQKTWNNALDDRVAEQGGLYADGSGAAAVQLDFFRNSIDRHNGIDCYELQGETRIWYRPRVLPTASGPVEFGTALLESGHQTRLIAVTQCFSDGCRQSPVETARSLSFSWKPPANAEGVVPVSIALTRSAETNDRTAEAAMMRELEDYVLNLSLDDAKRLALLQKQSRHG